MVGVPFTHGEWVPAGRKLCSEAPVEPLDGRDCGKHLTIARVAERFGVAWSTLCAESVLAQTRRLLDMVGAARSRRSSSGPLSSPGILALPVHPRAATLHLTQGSTATGAPQSVTSSSTGSPAPPPLPVNRPTSGRIDGMALLPPAWSRHRWFRRLRCPTLAHRENWRGRRASGTCQSRQCHRGPSPWGAYPFAPSPTGSRQQPLNASAHFGRAAPFLHAHLTQYGWMGSPARGNLICTPLSNHATGRRQRARHTSKGPTTSRSRVLSRSRVFRSGPAFSR